MKPESSKTRALRAIALPLVLGIMAGSACAAGATNPDADQILRGMSRYLGGVKAFSVTADISSEVISVEGEKLQFNSSATALIERPARAHITRRGRFADSEIFFDGKTLTLYGKAANAYAQKEVAGTLDAALNALEQGIGISMPGGDLLIADPYAALASNVTSSGYYGTAYVGGVACHHLAFRTPRVDWQIWVKDGDEPLPMKYVVTTKWMTGAPQFSVQFSNWNTKAAVAASRFTFVVPKGALKLTEIPVDESGEVLSTQGSK